MQRHVVAVAAGLALTIGAGIGALVASAGGAAAMAGCTTVYASSTAANSGNLPGPFIHPPVVGVTLGNPTLFASNQEAYTTAYEGCVVADPTGGL